jgi:hypothetical protein
MYEQNATIGAPSRETEIRKEVETLDKGLSVLAQTIEELGKRISPILSNNPPKVCEGKTDCPRITDFGGQLGSFNGRIGESIVILKGIIDRVEL